MSSRGRGRSDRRDDPSNQEQEKVTLEAIPHAGVATLPGEMKERLLPSSLCAVHQLVRGV